MSVEDLAGRDLPGYDHLPNLVLREAGALILGKTNVPPLLDDYTSSNADFGITRNPWDLARTPGGSSGGAAAAVSAGFSVADLGSDLYGSTRMPASWCGIFAHRPTNGLVSKLGHMPEFPDARIEPPLSTVGPLTRCAGDLASMLAAMTGREGHTARGWEIALPPPSRSVLPGTRVALWLDEPAAPIDSETRVALLAFGERLRDAGCEVSQLPAGIAGPDAVELLDRLKAIELAHNIAGPRRDLAAAWADWEEQHRRSELWTGRFRYVDIIVAPATFSAAPLLPELPADQRWVDHGGQAVRAMDFYSAWSKLTNIAKGPATVIPLGLGHESGLPIGAQLLGPYMGDLTTLWFARQLEWAGVVSSISPPR
ncbi:amidase family protein [Pseudofrankia sp. DC12]|uniref:amidase family protein n=1 Tax=Pseudofrankia sp. DC12 TaxID=683315 RepID=UPI0005F7AA5F|nr:amidase family protein [Pseudofrankia sp. DC12]